MLQAVDHELRQNDHAGPSHPCAAVDHDGRVPGCDAFQHAVGVAPDRLDFLQVGCGRERESRHPRTTRDFAARGMGERHQD